MTNDQVPAFQPLTGIYEPSAVQQRIEPQRAGARTVGGELPDTGHAGPANAALTVPYAERIDQMQRKSIPEVTEALGTAARTLFARIGGMGFSEPTERGGQGEFSQASGPRRRALSS